MQEDGFNARIKLARRPREVVQQLREAQRAGVVSPGLLDSALNAVENLGGQDATPDVDVGAAAPCSADNSSEGAEAG